MRVFEEYDEDPPVTNFLIVLMEHREIKMVSAGDKNGGTEFL